jgi:hypothetical protein
VLRFYSSVRPRLPFGAGRKYSIAFAASLLAGGDGSTVTAGRDRSSDLKHAGCCHPPPHERAVERGRQGDRDDPAGRDRMTKAHDQVSVASGRRLRQATRDAKLQQRVVTETGRAMFRNMPPVVRLRILGRLKKLAADAEAEITRARDHAHLRAGMMKLMTLTAMIGAAHGQTPG